MAEPLDQEIDQEVLDTETPEAPTEGVDEPEVEAEEEQEEEAEEEPKISRRAELRIQKLVSQLHRNGTEVPAPRSDSGLNYKEALEADDATISELEKDRRAYGEQLYRQGLDQAKSMQFRTRLEIDAPKVEAKYAVLDKESPKFNPVVADSINQWYLSTVGYDSSTGKVANADVRYSDFVESIMELSDEVASEKVSRTQKNIAKQAATTGLRPSGGTAKRLNLNQAPENMNDDELKAVIAQAISSK